MQVELKSLEKIKRYLAHKVKLPELGEYARLNDDDLWLKMVIQFCVMGGTRMFDNLMRNETAFSGFKKEIGLNKLLSIKKDRVKRIETVLKNYKATRFYSKQAKKIDDILKEIKVVDKGHVVLLDRLSHKQDFSTIRKELRKRNKYFKLKSASDFMINVGLSHDVMALDTRLVRILKDHFGLNIDVRKVQRNKKIYESIEEAIREACKEIGISLAHLDRIFFKYSDKNAISFIIEDLQ
ncbi:MAG: hypothetical protein ACETVN_00185 [Asgard group archaeon]